MAVVSVWRNSICDYGFALGRIRTLEPDDSSEESNFVLYADANDLYVWAPVAAATVYEPEV